MGRFIGILVLIWSTASVSSASRASGVGCENTDKVYKKIVERYDETTAKEARLYEDGQNERQMIRNFGDDPTDDEVPSLKLLKERTAEINKCPVVDFAEEILDGCISKFDALSNKCYDELTAKANKAAADSKAQTDAIARKIAAQEADIVPSAKASKAALKTCRDTLVEALDSCEKSLDEIHSECKSALKEYEEQSDVCIRSEDVRYMKDTLESRLEKIDQIGDILCHGAKGLLKAAEGIATCQKGRWDIHKFAEKFIKSKQ